MLHRTTVCVVPHFVTGNVAGFGGAFRHILPPDGPRPSPAVSQLPTRLPVQICVARV